MINPNYVDGLELKIKELAAERDAALAQNAEFEQRINQFIESISQLSNQVVDLQNTRDDLERQNAELVGQVEALRKVGNQVINYGLNANYWAIEVGKTPAQCLRQIQADAGRKGFIAGYERCWRDAVGSRVPEFVVPYLSSEYADKVRSGEV